jgi:hypothetical protein
MDADLRPWVVSTDPEIIDRLLQRWGRLGPRENLEDYAHELGCRPNEELGQVNSIFVLTTTEGDRYPVWEPGPNRRLKQSPVD